MHINAENIIELFHSKTFPCEKEGKLLVQCGNNDLLQKSYHECLCRLRGNLLLVAELNNSLAKTDYIVQLLVLNNFEIKLCDESKNYEFCIGLCNKHSSNQSKYYFICESRSERDKWIESIYLASFNFLIPFHKALIDQIIRQNKTFLVDNNRIDTCHIGSTNQIITIKCDNIQCTSNFEPNLFVRVFYRRSYIDSTWNYLGTTEQIYSTSPNFCCGIGLPKSSLSLIELKFELHNVLEKHFQSSYLLAFAYFHFNRNFIIDQKLYFTIQLLSTVQYRSVGTLKFRIFKELYPKIPKSLSLNNLSSTEELILKNSNLKSTSSMENLNEAIDSSRPCLNNDLFTNTISKRFSFQSRDSNQIVIEEFMSESKFSFLVPQILLKLYAQDEKSAKCFCETFLSNHPVKFNFQQTLIGFHEKFLKMIDETQIEIVNFMSKYSFRPSKNKTEPFLQFIPTNFHKQFWRVCDQKHSYSRSVFTVGAYTCHYLGYYKDHGMKSMLISTNEYSDAINAWSMFRKLLKVLRCETKICDVLDQIETVVTVNTVDSNEIEHQYKIVCSISEELIDLVSIDEAEVLFEYFNSFIDVNVNINDEFQLEPIDLIYLNIKACLVAINYKLSQKTLSSQDIESCNRKLKLAINSLRKVILVCYMTVFAKLNKEQIEMLYRLRFRQLSLLTQTLSTFIISTMDKIENEPKFLEQIVRTKYIVIEHETLLSCYSKEMGMLEDMTYAIEELSNSVIPVFSFSDDTTNASMPDIECFGDKFRLVFHVKRLPEMDQNCRINCKVMSLIFNIGVNHHGTLADKLGSSAYQDELNELSFNKLKGFITQYYKDNEKISSLLEQLKIEMKSSKSKNIQKLYFAGQIVHLLNGIKMTCCKSAKDRTGMSITLEEVRFCFESFGIEKYVEQRELFQVMLDTLRRYAKYNPSLSNDDIYNPRNGTRMENVYKNIGVKQYAFSYIQLLTFPSHYRPPSGTYSIVET